MTYFMIPKVTMTFHVGLTYFMIPKGHGDLLGRYDLLYDFKGHDDLDLVIDQMVKHSPRQNNAKTRCAHFRHDKICTP